MSYRSRDGNVLNQIFTEASLDRKDICKSILVERRYMLDQKIQVQGKMRNVEERIRQMKKEAMELDNLLLEKEQREELDKSNKNNK